MKKLNFYWFAFIIGVVCAGYVLYGGRLTESAMTPAFLNPNHATLFPAPGETAYVLRLYLDPADRTLHGDTALTTCNTSGKPLSELWFTVYPNAFRQKDSTPAPAEAYYSGFNPGGIDFLEILVNGQQAQHAEEGVSMKVFLPHDLMPGAKVEVRMKWKAEVPRVSYRYGTRDGVYMLGNFNPTLNVLDQEGWHNTYNSAFGDPFCFHCADYLVELNIPEFYQMASSGSSKAPVVEDNGRQTYVISAQNARDFSLALMYDYTELQKNMNKLKIGCYIPKGQEETAEKVLEQTTSILNYYNCTLGTYPYPEFKIVFVPMKGFHGMEHSGMIFLSQDFLQEPWPGKQGEFILAHEIAHQWWYGMVGNDQLKEPWLDEGLANWSTYKYLQDVEKRPPPASAYQEGLNLGRELREMYSRQDYYLTAYSGGEAFWFGLEKEIGTEAVIKVLHRYLADYRFKVASTPDLLSVIRKEAHQDMNDYFYKWFQVEPGH